jgi:type VI protein secretion system component Hcp
VTQRFQLRLLSAALCLVALGAFPLQAGASVYACIGQNSNNYLYAQFLNCPAVQAASIRQFSLGASIAGGSAGKPTGLQVTLSHTVDASSKAWAESLLKGVRVASTLVVGITQSTTTTTSNVTVVLFNPQVVSLSVDTGIDDGVPVETITLSYQKITIVDNSVTPPSTINWP